MFTAVACGLYNLVAGWTGGIEVQVESVGPSPVTPVCGAAPPAAPSAPPPTPGSAPWGG